MYHGRTYQSINVLLLKSFKKILEIVAHFELKKINNSQFITISIMQSIFFSDTSTQNLWKRTISKHGENLSYFSPSLKVLFEKILR